MEWQLLKFLTHASAKNNRQQFIAVVGKKEKSENLIATITYNAGQLKYGLYQNYA